MDIRTKISGFLSRHKFVIPEQKYLIESITADMQAGLDKEPDSSATSGSQPMIPASSNIPEGTPKNKSVIVIDAGGTNFRSCLVSFDADGKPTISDLEKKQMPAIDRELSKDEFYDAIAMNLEHLKNKATRIGFCFSYAMKITPDDDGIVMNFSKEVKAPEVVGTCVGKCLSEALVKRGWKKPEKITLLNDTMASLLSGAASVKNGKKYSSYIGLILGTGLNLAYVEYEPIKKLAEKNPAKHIVVCESGVYNKFPKSDFDVEVDKNSVKPGYGLLEKLCSGAYFGKVAFIMLKAGCGDKLFSEGFSNVYSKYEEISAFDVDCFMSAPFDSETKLGACVAGGTAEDADILYMLMDLLYERSAAIVTGLLSAAILKSGKGTQQTMPVCIEANGSMFWKGYRLYEKILSKMKSTLYDGYHRYYEIVEVENDITLGTAIAGAL